MTQSIIDIGDAPNDGTGDPVREAFNKCNNNFSELYAAGSGGTATPPQGRLTLQTATPVMTTTQSAKTTIFYTPYNGNQIVLYDGTSMVPTTFVELSALTTDATKSPGAILASQVHDWFIWNDAGTIRLGHGPAWTNDTTRSAGAVLAMVNGIWLNAFAITNGAALQRGTYVGTTRSNGSSQLDWIYPAIAAGGTQGFFGVWNCYNRCRVSGIVGDTAASYTYAAADWRPLNNSPTMRIYVTCGLAEDAVTAEASSRAGGATGDAAIGVGVNSTTVASGTLGYINTSGLGAGNSLSSMGAYGGQMQPGFTFYAPLEWAAATTSFTGQATFSSDIYLQNGLRVTFWA